MKRVSVGFMMLLLLLSQPALFSFEVDTDELSRTGNEDIRFENYVGPHSKIETIEEIRGIGIYLGRRIASGFTTASYFSRYEVLHAVDPAAEKGLDADIFSILKAAEVDHVRSIRWMLDGYLSTVYAYSREDAELLARFITLYNAVHRKDLSYLSDVYKPSVTALLRSDRAGLSLNYSEWPGGTQILIPLTSGILEERDSRPDSGALSGKEVVEELRKQEDRGIDLRKDMVDLKERELEQAEDALAGERGRLEDERQLLAEEREETVEKLREVEAVKPIVLAKPASPEKESELAELREVEERLKRQSAELETRAQDVDEKLVRLEKKESALEGKRVEIRNDREGIAEDQKALVTAEEKAASVPAVQRTPAETAVVPASAAGTASGERQTGEPADDESRKPAAQAVTVASALLGRGETVYFVQRVSGGTEAVGRLVIIDPRTGTVERSSSLNSIRGRLFGYFDGKILVIAGRDDRGGAVRMHLLDRTTLETLFVGSDDIYPGSAVRITGTHFLAVTASGGGWKLGKFDTGLKLVALSAEDVEPDTFLSVTEDRAFLQAKDGTVLSLKLDDLSSIQ